MSFRWGLAYVQSAAQGKRREAPKYYTNRRRPIRVKPFRPVSVLVLGPFQLATGTDPRSRNNIHDTRGRLFQLTNSRESVLPYPF